MISTLLLLLLLLLVLLLAAVLFTRGLEVAMNSVATESRPEISRSRSKLRKPVPWYIDYIISI